MDSYYSLFKCPLGIILIALKCYMSFCYHLSGWKILFLTYNYWIKHFNELSWDVSSWILNNLLNRKQRSRNLRILIFYWIVYHLNYITLDVDLTIFLSQYWTLVLFVDHTYYFTSGMMIPYLAHWNYAQMDVFFR